MPDFGNRIDGTPKGLGFFGLLPTPQGDPATSSFSVNANVNGKDLFMPSLVPTLDPSEVNHLLLGNQPTRAIMEKAIAHALKRQEAGQSTFAGPQDKPVQWGVPWRKPNAP